MDAAARAAESVADRLDALAAPAVPVLCHDDFSPDNLLFEGEAVTGVLDFDLARAGHPHRDLVKAANAFWMHDPAADWDVRGAVYRGYRAAAGLGDSFAEREPLYRVETLVEILAGMLDLDALPAAERAVYGRRLREAVERVGTA
jgi:aminoglycoside phosphotransferase (APT) family kinase protein